MSKIDPTKEGKTKDAKKITKPLVYQTYVPVQNSCKSGICEYKTK